MFLKREQTGLWLVDVQEKLFPHVDRGHEVLEKMVFALEGAKLLDLPLMVTEQYPQSLGETIAPLKERLPEGCVRHGKMAFSGYHDSKTRAAADQLRSSTWILIGIEAHICVLQTAKDLLAAGKQVVVLNDAITSRSLFDFSTAIAEMKEAGARISSVETVIYELLRDAGDPAFKTLLPLIKAHA